MSESLKQRIVWIDYLKFICLCGLIVAHISTNSIVLHIRAFDVNLLIILSAILSSKSSDYKSIEYYKKRLIRLVIPTWIFITLYLIINAFVHFEEISPMKIIRSYALQDNSIGYVWIVYVYVICAFLSPILNTISQKYNNDSSILIISGIVFLAYTILCRVTSNYYYRIIVLYPIIYGLISFIGINWKRLNKSTKIWFIIICISIHVAWGLIYFYRFGKIAIINSYKYPPRIYYLSYTIGMSLLLIELFKRVNLKESRMVEFVSRNSLWAYLWHILSIHIIKVINITNEAMSFVIVLLLSISVTYCQSKVIAFCEKKGVPKSKTQFFKG